MKLFYLIFVFNIFFVKTHFVHSTQNNETYIPSMYQSVWDIEQSSNSADGYLTSGITALGSRSLFDKGLLVRPCRSGAKFSDNYQNNANLLKRAYRIREDGLEDINYGHVADVMTQLAGLTCRYHFIDSQANSWNNSVCSKNSWNVANLLKSSYENGDILFAATHGFRFKPKLEENQFITQTGLLPNHQFIIGDIYTFRNQKDYQKEIVLLKLFDNSHRSVPNGKWSASSSTWTDNPQIRAEIKPDEQPNGTLFLDVCDFERFFSIVHICPVNNEHLHRDFPNLKFPLKSTDHAQMLGVQFEVLESTTFVKFNSIQPKASKKMANLPVIPMVTVIYRQNHVTHPFLNASCFTDYVHTTVEGEFERGNYLVISFALNQMKSDESRFSQETSISTLFQWSNRPIVTNQVGFTVDAYWHAFLDYLKNTWTFKQSICNYEEIGTHEKSCVHYYQVFESHYEGQVFYLIANPTNSPVEVSMQIEIEKESFVDFGRGSSAVFDILQPKHCYLANYWTRKRTTQNELKSSVTFEFRRQFGSVVNEFDPSIQGLAQFVQYEMHDIDTDFVHERVHNDGLNIDCRDKTSPEKTD